MEKMDYVWTVNNKEVISGNVYNEIYKETENIFMDRKYSICEYLNFRCSR